MLDGAADVLAAWRAGIKPEPLLTVSEWAEQNRILSGKGSSEPGPWRNSRTPYLAEIMDCLSTSSSTQRVVFMKGAQVGATESGNNWVGYVIEHAPGPMLVVQPTVELGKRFSRQRIEPLLEETPSLKTLVAAPRERDSGNTMLSKDFPGGQLVITGANSAVGLRSMTARNLFLDEIDAYPGDVEEEGDPIALASARSRTYGRRKKIFLVSTPTIAGSSRIEREYLASDQRRFFVPCPHCHAMQWLQFDRLRWPKNDTASAAYHCEACDVPIPERHKTWMLSRGEWRATQESEDPTTVGFHISALYSPVGWLSWAEIAKDWMAAQGKPQDLKTFRNTVLGEVWEERGDAPDWQRLYDRREEWTPGAVPMGALLLTAGIDVQRDRIEASVWGWGRNRESWLVEHIVVPGTPFETATWDRVAAALGASYPHEAGGALVIAQAAVDSGDGVSTAEVYAFCRRIGARRVVAVKGKDGLAMAIAPGGKTEVKRNGQKIGKQALWLVGSSYLKGELYGRLRLERPTDESGEAYPTGFVHLPRHAAGEEYCRQLVAEALKRVKNTRGYTTLQWVKERDRNEALDCWVYARAAASLRGVDRWSEARWDEHAAAAQAAPPAIDHEDEDDDGEALAAPVVVPAMPPPTARPAAQPKQQGGWMPSVSDDWMPSTSDWR
jgi:phage terminase large subunit GpA-like protein